MWYGHNMLLGVKVEFWDQLWCLGRTVVFGRVLNTGCDMKCDWNFWIKSWEIWMKKISKIYIVMQQFSITDSSVSMMGFLVPIYIQLSKKERDIYVCRHACIYVCIQQTFNIMALRWFAIAEFLILSSYCSFRFRAISASVNIWEELCQQPIQSWNTVANVIMSSDKMINPMKLPWYGGFRSHLSPQYLNPLWHSSLENELYSQL